MGRGTWKNFELILWSREGGGGSQFLGLGVPQRKDMKHVNKWIFLLTNEQNDHKKLIWLPAL